MPLSSEGMARALNRRTSEELQWTPELFALARCCIRNGPELPAVNTVDAAGLVYLDCAIHVMIMKNSLKNSSTFHLFGLLSLQKGTLAIDGNSRNRYLKRVAVEIRRR